MKVRGTETTNAHCDNAVDLFQRVEHDDSRLIKKIRNGWRPPVNWDNPVHKAIYELCTEVVISFDVFNYHGKVEGLREHLGFGMK